MSPRSRAADYGVGLLGGGVALFLGVLAGCTTPGAIAPSTVPVGENFVELGGRQTNSSCGYTLLSIPLKNPAPLSTLIEELIAGKGGDAMIEVTSNSSTAFYLLGAANCLEVQGKVVKVGK